MKRTKEEEPFCVALHGVGFFFKGAKAIHR